VVGVAVHRVETLVRGGLTFDVRDTGPADGDPILLLHGFPQDLHSWDAVVPRLHASGFRTLVPDQRGYSPRARPRRRRDYRIPLLADDAAALADAVGRSVHVVGHDWGAAVAWTLAARRPDLVRTLTAVSVPHPAAFLRSFVTSTQLLKSWYMFAFQLPWLPERLLSTPSIGTAMLRRTGQGPEAAARMSDPSVVRGGLHWYRAMPLSGPKASLARVSVPTLMVWSDRDTAIGRAGVDATARYVTGPYRLAIFRGVSHWIPDETPDRLADEILDHIAEPTR